MKIEATADMKMKIEEKKIVVGCMPVCISSIHDWDGQIFLGPNIPKREKYTK
jgi:hypothetical protein